MQDVHADAGLNRSKRGARQLGRMRFVSMCLSLADVDAFHPLIRNI